MLPGRLQSGKTCPWFPALPSASHPSQHSKAHCVETQAEQTAVRLPATPGQSRQSRRLFACLQCMGRAESRSLAGSPLCIQAHMKAGSKWPMRSRKSIWPFARRPHPAKQAEQTAVCSLPSRRPFARLPTPAQCMGRADSHSLAGCPLCIQAHPNNESRLQNGAMWSRQKKNKKQKKECKRQMQPAWCAGAER